MCYLADALVLPKFQVVLPALLLLVGVGLGDGSGSAQAGKDATLTTISAAAANARIVLVRFVISFPPVGLKSVG
jgi:hypothetical protein